MSYIYVIRHKSFFFKEYNTFKKYSKYCIKYFQKEYVKNIQNTIFQNCIQNTTKVSKKKNNSNIWEGLVRVLYKS